MNEIHLMANIINAVRICPKNVEATVFEVIMGIINLGYLVSYESGGLISSKLNITATNFDNLYIQILIASIFPLIALISIVFVPNNLFNLKKEEAEA